MRRGTFNLWSTYLRRISQGMEKEFEETALKAPSEIDGRALMWTYESLDEDHELEQFFAGIPGFCSSKVVDNPQSSLDSLRGRTVVSSLNGFLERTWLSNLVSETIKMRRLVICVRAIDAAHLSRAADEIFYLFFLPRPMLLQSLELGHSLVSWDNSADRKTTLFAQGIIACVIANVPQRNERWFSLTMHHLGISEHVLRSYLDHGNSVLLANLTHFTRQFVHNFLKANWEQFPVLYILRQLRSNYNVQDALPSLRHDFCSLWNGVVLQRRGRHHHLLFNILWELRSIYVALHQGSTPSDDFQLCSIPCHRIDSAPNLNEVDGGRTAETPRAPITTSPVLHRHDAVPSVIPLVTQYDAPPSPASNLDHTIPHLEDEQSHNRMLDNITPVASPLHLAPLENDPISNDTAANSIQGTTDPSAVSSMINTGSRSPSSHGTALQPASDRNMTTATPFVPDAGPSPIALLTVSPDPAAPHISADPTVNQSDRSPEDGSMSHSSSQNFTPFPLAPQVISGFDSNGATEIGRLDAPDDTLDLNRRFMSHSSTPSSPGAAEYSLQPGDGDPSETSGPSQ